METYSQMVLVNIADTAAAQAAAKLQIHKRELLLGRKKKRMTAKRYLPSVVFTAAKAATSPRSADAMFEADPGLKPYQPNQRQNVPRNCIIEKNRIGGRSPHGIFHEYMFRCVPAMQHCGEGIPPVALEDFRPDHEIVRCEDQGLLLRPRHRRHPTYAPDQNRQNQPLRLPKADLPRTQRESHGSTKTHGLQPGTQTRPRIPNTANRLAFASVPRQNQPRLL